MEKNDEHFLLSLYLSHIKLRVKARGCMLSGRHHDIGFKMKYWPL